jgi:hypothetical protein
MQNMTAPFISGDDHSSTLPLPVCVKCDPRGFEAPVEGLEVAVEHGLESRPPVPDFLSATRGACEFWRIRLKRRFSLVSPQNSSLIVNCAERGPPTA